MYKMSIRRNRINLAAGSLELRILICQILKFCGAYKSEIRRIEKEHTPFAQHILLFHSFKFALLKSLYLKISNFFVN